MHDWLELFEKPESTENYMLVGWRQWADAGSISSGLPHYLIEQTGARKIGRIKSDDLYLFQFPGTHHYLRPEIKLEEGYCVEMSERNNDLYYTNQNGRGFFIFVGEEPHLNVERYADAFFSIMETFDIRRVAAVGGVYGAMPYDKDRDIACAYSLRRMKDELANYAVRFSNYEGGATIGSYLLNHAKKRELEFFVFYAFVPAYDLSQLSQTLQGMRIEHDYKAWYDLIRRFNHMFGMTINLADLESQSATLAESMSRKLDEIEQRLPQHNLREYIDSLAEDFTERTFMPLDDVWERELGDLLEDLDD